MTTSVVTSEEAVAATVVAASVVSTENVADSVSDAVTTVMHGCVMNRGVVHRHVMNGSSHDVNGRGVHSWHSVAWWIGTHGRCLVAHGRSGIAHGRSGVTLRRVLAWWH